MIDENIRIWYNSIHKVNKIVARENRKVPLEESPGSIERGYLITSSGGDPRESAIENNSLKRLR